MRVAARFCGLSWPPGGAACLRCSASWGCAGPWLRGCPQRLRAASFASGHPPASTGSRASATFVTPWRTAAWQNGPFCLAEWPVSQGRTGGFAPPNGPPAKCRGGVVVVAHGRRARASAASCGRGQGVGRRQKGFFNARGLGGSGNNAYLCKRSKKRRRGYDEDSGIGVCRDSFFL